MKHDFGSVPAEERAPEGSTRTASGKGTKDRVDHRAEGNVTLAVAPTLRETIRQARRTRHWNREKLAVEAGVSLSLIARVELGHVPTHLDILIRLADALGLDTDDVILLAAHDFRAAQVPDASDGD